jgi:hypothetical protein
MPPSEAIAAPQVWCRHCHASFPFPGATKGGTFTGAGQSYRRDLCRHIGYRPPSNRHHRCLYHRLTRFYVASPLNPIFMLGGALEAHEVLSKMPRGSSGSTGFDCEDLPRGISDQG